MSEQKDLDRQEQLARIENIRVDTDLKSEELLIKQRTNRLFYYVSLVGLLAGIATALTKLINLFR
ncbi:MAG: hypothetical protein ACR2PT_23655 [Endozoicomonas sp.]